MATDKEQPCTAESAEECDHMADGPIPFKPQDDEERFQIQQFADEHFPAHRSNKAHKGKRSEMIRAAVRTFISEHDDDTVDVPTGSTSDGFAEDVQELREEKRTLENRLERTESELDEAQEKMRQYREDATRWMVRPVSDQIMFRLGIIVQKALEDGKTLDGLTEILRQHGVEDDLEKIQRIEDPPERYEDTPLWEVETLQDLAEHLVGQLQDEQRVKVTTKNGRHIYTTTGNV